MRELPDPSRAAIERALADLELAAIRVAHEPDVIIPDGNGGYTYGGPTATEKIQTATLAALGTIVKMVTDLEWTAADRRETVTFYQDQILTQYGIDRARFVAALRAQPWWLTFQRSLRQAEQTDIPSLGYQLRVLMDEARRSDADLAAAPKRHPGKLEGLSAKQLKRLRNDQAVPRPETVDMLEATFSKRLGRTIRLNTPPRRARSRVPKKSPKRP